MTNNLFHVKQSKLYVFAFQLSKITIVTKNKVCTWLSCLDIEKV